MRSGSSASKYDRGAPYLTLAWDIWGLKIHLERRVIAQGAEQVQAYLGAQLALLRSRSSQYRITIEVAYE
jgi:hypothetical protein